MLIDVDCSYIVIFDLFSQDCLHAILSKVTASDWLTVDTEVYQVQTFHPVRPCLAPCEEN